MLDPIDIPGDGLEILDPIAIPLVFIFVPIATLEWSADV